ncbi:WAT1-related protein At4g08300-like [Malania oleifera]|uniref:WAT1-related protein At4g08300-like n=1 Tax=Malania oleifera TaxID=397392 RepID=UPI0025AE9333|nr:WAT1-related protein At4g08300-like [Malania oleifera]
MEMAYGMGRGGVLRKVKLFLGIISLQFGYAGMYIITMVSFKHGMSHFVLVVYRHAVATLAIAPFALVLERKIRPKMTMSVFLKILALGILEPVIDQNLYYLGMKYTSATFASASVNVLPAVTFIMAVIFRLERISIKKVHSQAKVIGTVVTVTGAMVMTLYKGPVLDFIRSQGRSRHGTATASTDQHWLTGTLMLLASACGWSGFFILQSFTLRQYPAELSLTTMICIAGMVQGGAVALVMERNTAVWVIGWDSRLLAAVYSGVICSGMAYYVQGVVIKERGPVFVTAFSPLCMIITAALGSLVLAEQIHLGSVIGAVIIVTGLYSVVWGKSKDQKAASGGSTTAAAATAQELPVVDNTAAKSQLDRSLSTTAMSTPTDLLHAGDSTVIIPPKNSPV